MRAFRRRYIPTVLYAWLQVVRDERWRVERRALEIEAEEMLRVKDALEVRVFNLVRELKNKLGHPDAEEAESTLLSSLLAEEQEDWIQKLSETVVSLTDERSQQDKLVEHLHRRVEWLQKALEEFQRGTAFEVVENAVFDDEQLLNFTDGPVIAEIGSEIDDRGSLLDADVSRTVSPDLSRVPLDDGFSKLVKNALYEDELAAVTPAPDRREVKYERFTSPFAAAVEAVVDGQRPCPHTSVELVNTFFADTAAVGEGVPSQPVD